MTGNKVTNFPKKHIIITAIIATVILVGIIIGVIIYNNSQNAEVKFDSKQIYNNYVEINEKALDIEEKYTTDGFIQPEDISTVLDELGILAKEYKSKGLISDYDKQSTSIYFKLNSGIGYLYTPTVKELLAGDDIGKILTIEPYATSSEFVSNYLIGGKSPDKAAENIVKKLPNNYSFSKEDNWDAFSFEQVGQIGKHKIIIWYGHGGYVKEYGSVLGTSIPIKDQSSLLLYQLELSNGEMILGKDCFCISPSYFEKHIEDNSLEGSLVFLGACQSAMDNRLAEVFINKGSSLVVGNSQTIRIRYMLYMMDDFMSALTNQYDDGTCWTAEDALAYAKSQNGNKDSEFWAYGAEVKLIYPENKSRYRLYSDDNSNETMKPIDFLEGYWENNIQCYTVYQFLKDGTANEYQAEYGAELVPENLFLSLTLHYQWDGKLLTIDRGNGFKRTLELVTKESDIEWDGGLSKQISEIPEGEEFFYETGWIESSPTDNAMYLVRSRTKEKSNNSGIDNVKVQPSIDEMIDLILTHYKESGLFSSNGNYVIYNNEVIEKANKRTFVIRYQMSNEEAQEYLDRGSFPPANRYVTSVVVDMVTGIVSDEISPSNKWNMW